MEGKLLGKSGDFRSYRVKGKNSCWPKNLLEVILIRALSSLLVDAEEAQSKIEELRDQEYNERRSAILTQNDIEMNELLEQRKEHIRDFDRNWNEHEKQLVQSSQADLEALEQTHMQQLMQFREEYER